MCFTGRLKQIKYPARSFSLKFLVQPPIYVPPGVVITLYRMPAIEINPSRLESTHTYDIYEFNGVLVSTCCI